MGSIRIGIDTGGTFTDVVALDETNGRIVTTKTPSTPSDPADGFMNGLVPPLLALRKMHLSNRPLARLLSQGRIGTQFEGLGRTLASEI